MWTSDCQNAFETLKMKLTTAPILAKANIHKPFVLETDPSQHHVTAVLMQYNDNSLPQIVAYFLKKLWPVERQYSAMDREALAIVLACCQFNSYLWGTQFTIQTDHQPVVSVFKHKTKSPRMNRWILEMRDYQYRIEYKQGRKNVVTDHLSQPVRVIQHNEEQWLGKSKEELIEMQGRERRWNEVVEYLRGGRVPNPISREPP